MAEVLLFHHAQGLTPGCLALADRLRDAGHDVHTPDLYDGRTFAALDEGVAHAEAVGFETILDRGRAAAERLRGELVYVGLSLGVLPAQTLAQSRAGAQGAVLLHSCVRPAELGGAWPAEVPVQIHLGESDEWVLPPNEDLAAARDLAAGVTTAELFLYPGDSHLFTDESLPSYDADATALVTKRMVGFLNAL